MTTFDDFWAVCPPKRKVDKAIAKAKFNAITSLHGLATKARDGDGNMHPLTLKATPDELVEGMKAARVVWMREDTPDKFIPHPTTWLNKGRFMDMDEDERRELAARFDDIQRRVVELRRAG